MRSDKMMVKYIEFYWNPQNNVCFSPFVGLTRIRPNLAPNENIPDRNKTGKPTPTKCWRSGASKVIFNGMV